MMKVLLLSHSPNNIDAGASRVYHILARGLADLGHDVQLLHQEDFSLPHWEPAKRFTERLLMPWQVSSEAAALINKSRFDVVMASSGMAYPLFSRIKDGAPRPLLVSHLHGLASYDYASNVFESRLGHRRISLLQNFVTGPVQARWDAAGVRLADLNIVQNLRDVGELQHICRGSTPSVVLIAPAVHSELMRMSDSVPSAESRSPFELVWFATWESRKGASYIPLALRRIRSAHPEVKLTIGGTGRSEHEILSEFDVADRGSVEVLPRISRADQADLLRRGSVFLFPSLSEGFGLALLEAMCFGVVGLSTNTGFAADYIIDRDNGVVVPASSEHIARAVCDLIADPLLRVSIAEKGRLLARTFTEESMVRSYASALMARLASHGD